MTYHALVAVYYPPPVIVRSKAGPVYPLGGLGSHLGRQNVGGGKLSNQRMF